MFRVTLAFDEVNNNGLRGGEMSAVVAQGQKLGSEDAERARAEEVGAWMPAGLGLRLVMECTPSS